MFNMPVFSPGRFRRFAICAALFSSLVAAAAPENRPAWRLLLENDPVQAAAIMTHNSRHADPCVAGEALRGLSVISSFMGDDSAAMALTFAAFIKDPDTLLLDAAWSSTLLFGRSWSGHFIKDGYTVLRQLTRQPGPHTGEYSSTLIDRLVNDGKVAAARAVADRMGIVRTFRMIGPFDNVSGCGHASVYPPEQSLDFNATHTGKNGNRISWFPFVNTAPDGWVFTQYNYADLNATHYYYATVRSDRDQELFMGFGASGTFKVFVNSALALADSVFRNTGTDVFVQRVRLRKGDNALLIKIGHEAAHSNFLVRFFDHSGQAPLSIRVDNRPAHFQPDTTRYPDLLSTPGVHRVTSELHKRLSADEQDFEAAILLMQYYNTIEFTDEGQRLAHRYLALYPRSSLWHSLYYESLLRSRKKTDAQGALKTAYTLCPLNALAWTSELATLASSASPQQVLQFIDSAPAQLRTHSQALITRMVALARVENESRALKTLDTLEKLHSSNRTVVEILVNYYLNQGNTAKARQLLTRTLQWNRSWRDGYATLAAIQLKMGQVSAAIRTYQACLKYAPVSPGYFYYLANLSLQMKKFDAAHTYSQQALAFMPSSQNLLNQHATILASRDRTGDAITTLRRSIQFNYDNFNAWDQIMSLQGTKPLLTRLELPQIDSLVTQCAAWPDRSFEKGAVVSRIRDVILYPSRCSRERSFLVVHLPTQGAIDMWKEYTIPYNGHYQVLNISRAASRSAGGTETPADINRNTVVFKTLQPGDFIILEWTLQNHYEGAMAANVWGDYNFDINFPAMYSAIRFLTPSADTIPFTLQGEALQVTRTSRDEYVLTEISRPAFRQPAEEFFAPIDPPDANKVNYSTFDDWRQIVSWYGTITANKIEPTAEVRKLADSLFTGRTGHADKVRAMHEFITGSIRYSFVPFRQSGWVPQAAGDVLATKIGDCKDMATLAKSLLDCAAIPCALVLVNTRDQAGTAPGYIGPNFNHCILSYTVEGQRRYCDLTDNSISAAFLPKMDQGAVSLIIDTALDAPVFLPVDSSAQRVTRRVVHSGIDSLGGKHSTVNTLKSGIATGYMRRSYRFKSYPESRILLQKSLSDDYAEVSVDTLFFQGLDSLGDSLTYQYRYRAPRAVTLSANTAIFALNPADKLEGDAIPAADNRIRDIDLSQAWYDVGYFSCTGKIDIPPAWRLISIPEDVTLQSEFGSYRLQIRQVGAQIQYDREARFDNPAVIKAADSGKLKDFLSKIVQADKTQLMFYTR